MTRYPVVGSVTFSFDVDVEAESEEEAEDKVAAMTSYALVENSGMPDVEVDGVTELKAVVPKK